MKRTGWWDDLGQRSLDLRQEDLQAVKQLSVGGLSCIFACKSHALQQHNKPGNYKQERCCGALQPEAPLILCSIMSANSARQPRKLFTELRMARRRMIDCRYEPKIQNPCSRANMAVQVWAIWFRKRGCTHAMSHAPYRVELVPMSSINSRGLIIHLFLNLPLLQVLLLPPESGDGVAIALFEPVIVSGDIFDLIKLGKLVKLKAT